MNKVYRINIIQADNGFMVQGANQHHVATNEEEVRVAIAGIVAAIFNPPPKPERTTSTVTTFGNPHQIIGKS